MFLQAGFCPRAGLLLGPGSRVLLGLCTVLQASQVCGFHKPDRQAVGLKTVCRGVICSAASVQLVCNSTRVRAGSGVQPLRCPLFALTAPSQSGAAPPQCHQHTACSPAKHSSVSVRTHTDSSLQAAVHT